MINQVDSNTIVFFIRDEEKIKITLEGFFVNGKLTAEDKEVYHAFKDFLTSAKIQKDTLTNPLPKDKIVKIDSHVVAGFNGA